jgi:hypothetical protein
MFKRHAGRVNFSPGWRLAFLGAILSVGPIGCSPRVVFTRPPIAVDLEIAPRPVRVGPVIVTTEITTDRGKPVSGARVTLEADMSHPGMAPVLGEAQEIETGRYKGTLRLNMAGDWVVLAHAILADGQKLEGQIKINGVQTN